MGVPLLCQGVDGIREQLRILQRNAVREVLFLCKAGHVAMPSSTNDEEYLMLDRGVRYRVVYEQQMLEQPGVIDAVAMGIRHGEHARATGSVPVRLMVVDGTIGLCPLVPGTLEGPGADEPTAALLRESHLLTALIAVFEDAWERASPLHLQQRDAAADRLVTAGAPMSEHGLDEEDLHLLSLLVAGVTDKAIATQMGVSQRTVQRRLHDLMGRAGAETRMQLAWLVSQRGWLTQTA